MNNLIFPDFQNDLPDERIFRVYQFLLLLIRLI